MSNNSTSNGAVGFLGMLCILFIGLKLTNYIDWSWVWVLSPLWIPFGITVGVIAIIFVGALILTVCGYDINKE